MSIKSWKIKRQKCETLHICSFSWILLQVKNWRVSIIQPHIIKTERNCFVMRGSSRSISGMGNQRDRFGRGKNFDNWKKKNHFGFLSYFFFWRLDCLWREHRQRETGSFSFRSGNRGEGGDINPFYTSSSGKWFGKKRLILTRVIRR